MRRPQVNQAAFLVACLYTAIGTLRLGFVIRFLSHAVISGFICGAALLLASTQVGCRGRSPLWRAHFKGRASEPAAGRRTGNAARCQPAMHRDP